MGKSTIRCSNLILVDNKILGIQSIEKGFILPGGKWEPGEWFEQTALRELKEETGLEFNRAYLLFHAMNPYGTYVYVFRPSVPDVEYVKTAEGFATYEGIVGWGTFEDLFKSNYGAFYKTMYEEIN
jgi:8-oxo-dGTP pyrophosphatase MutT (NUDIX family)